MANLLPKSRRIARTLLSSVVASLFLLQAVAFIFSSNGRVAFSNGEAGASIAMAGEICVAKTDDEARRPRNPAITITVPFAASAGATTPSVRSRIWRKS